MTSNVIPEFHSEAFAICPIEPKILRDQEVFHDIHKMEKLIRQLFKSDQLCDTHD